MGLLDTAKLDAWVQDTLGVHPSVSGAWKTIADAVGNVPSGATAADLRGGTSAPAAAPAKAAPTTPAPVQAPSPGVLGATPATNIVTDQNVSPSTPFTTSPAVRVEVRNYAAAELRPIVMSLANTALTVYLSALAGVRSSLDKAEAQAQADQDAMLTAVLTVALIALNPVVEAAAAKLAGSAVKAGVLGQIEKNGPGLAKLAGIEGEAVGKALTAAAYSDLANSSLADMADKFDAAKAKAALGSGISALTGKAVKLTPVGDKWANGRAYLDALATAADAAAKDLAGVIGTMKDFESLVAYYGAFHAATIDFYKTTIAQQANDFMNQLAGPMAAQQAAQQGKQSKNDVLVKINAYGRMRFAHVRSHDDAGLIGSGGVSYSFDSWVTPDMEAMAAQMNPREIKGSDIVGHLPAPEKEATSSRVVQMNAWGRERLAIVQVGDIGWFSREYGVMNFVRWVAPNEMAQAQAQGGMQNGGINEVSPGDVKSLREPPKDS